VPTKRKKKLLRGFCISLIAVVLFWLILQFIVRFLLCRDVRNILEILDSTINHSPVFSISDVLSNQSGFTINAEIQSSENKKCVMQIISQTQRILANGEILQNDQNRTFSLYLDSDLLAFSPGQSSDLYYSISFDTFRQDIGKLPVISWILQDSTIDKFHERLLSLSKIWNSTNGFLKIPEIKLDDNTNIQKLLWILPAEIDIVSLWQSEGTIPAVRALYKLRGNQIPFGLEKVFGYPNIKETDITATFYLNGNCLRMSELIVCKKGERILQISVEQNRNVLQNTLRFIVRNEVAEEESGEIAIFLNTDGSEQWKIEGGQNDVSIHWIPTSGELRMDKRNNTLAVYYQAYENGFSIKTENIQNLIRFLEIWNTEGAEWNAGCKMDITKGADFQLPKLKNLNEWSLEDFVIILDWLDVLME